MYKRQHHYYALETGANVSVQRATEMAEQVGAELVEKIGELDGHWLVRAAKDRRRDIDEHQVLSNWESIKRQLDKRATKSSNHKRSVDSIQKLGHLPIRKRSKRTYIPVRHGNATDAYPAYHVLGARQDATEEPVQDLTELHFMQNEMNLKDPLLPKQWHLANTLMPEFELNVTKLWERGVTGKGVKVAIIDDGLDIDSDDLAANFVSVSNRTRKKRLDHLIVSTASPVSRRILGFQ